MWWLLTACIDSEIRERRQWEMQDHEADFFRALDALRAGDLATARQAAEGLAKKDPLPGVPPDTARYIEAVRAGARTLAAAPDPAAAKRELGAVSAQCAGCHRTVGMTAPAPVDESNPQNATWMALLFEDEVAWAKAQPASGPAGWDARRDTLLAALP
jgi:hypothetical protein